MHPSVLDLWKHCRRGKLASWLCNSLGYCECDSARGLRLHPGKSLSRNAFGGADAVGFSGFDNAQPRSFSDLLDTLPAPAIPRFSFRWLEFCTGSCDTVSCSAGHARGPAIRDTRRGAHKVLSPLGRLERRIAFYFASMDVHSALCVSGALVPFPASPGCKRSTTGAHRRAVLTTGCGAAEPLTLRRKKAHIIARPSGSHGFV